MEHKSTDCKRSSGFTWSLGDCVQNAFVGCFVVTSTGCGSFLSRHRMPRVEASIEAWRLAFDNVARFCFKWLVSPLSERALSVPPNDHGTSRR